VQEALAFQVDALEEAFPDYTLVGAGRDDGDRGGEFVPILFRTKLFQPIRSGHVWLSEQPERVGSVGWDAALPRMATWVVLAFKGSQLNQICFVNTHFDHRGKRARLGSAKLIRQMLEIRAGRAFVVMGDFNCGPGSAPYRELTDDRGNLAELQDPWYYLRSPLAKIGTYHGFTGATDKSPRIDWIMHNRRLEPTRVDIILDDYQGLWPSDHYPVTATLRLLPATRWGSV